MNICKIDSSRPIPEQVKAIKERDYKIFKAFCITMFVLNIIVAIFYISNANMGFNAAVNAGIAFGAVSGCITLLFLTSLLYHHQQIAKLQEQLRDLCITPPSNKNGSFRPSFDPSILAYSTRVCQKLKDQNLNKNSSFLFYA